MRQHLDYQRRKRRARDRAGREEAAAARGARAVIDPRNEDRKLEREMGKDMAHPAIEATPGEARFTKARRKGEHDAFVEIGEPFGPRHLRHAPEQPGFLARSHEHGPVLTQHDEGRPAPKLAFTLGALFRKALLIAFGARAARLLPRAKQASGLSG